MADRKLSLGVASLIVVTGSAGLARAADTTAPADGAAPPAAAPASGVAVAPPPAAPAPAPVDPAAAKQTADDADKLSDDFTSGKLIRYGITAGLAFTAVAPLQPSLQKQWAVTPMPYVGIFPLWWNLGPLGGTKGNITRAYCSEEFYTTSKDDAQQAANTMARNITAKHFQKVYAAHPDQAPKQGDPAFTDYEKNDVKWNESDEGRCNAGRFFGLYWGLPAKFNVNGKSTASDIVKARDYTPYSSFGIIIAPIAAISFMGGVTVSHATDDTMMAGLNHHVWSFSFGVGGNLDLAGALLK